VSPKKRIDLFLGQDLFPYAPLADRPVGGCKRSQRLGNDGIPPAVAGARAQPSESATRRESPPQAPRHTSLMVSVYSRVVQSYDCRSFASRSPSRCTGSRAIHSSAQAQEKGVLSPAGLERLLLRRISRREIPPHAAEVEPTQLSPRGRLRIPSETPAESAAPFRFSWVRALLRELHTYDGPPQFAG